MNTTQTTSSLKPLYVGLRVQHAGYEWAVTEIHPEWDAATIKNSHGEKVVPTAELSAAWFDQP